jgi:subtilisin-like proprotein convertase family protein/uncharacterized protein YrzB (UPF0473 family)
MIQNTIRSFVFAALFIVFGHSNLVAQGPYFQNCPGNMVVGNDLGDCGAIVDWVEPIAFDSLNNPIPVIQTLGLPPGSFFPVGLEAIIYTAADTFGNVIICSFIIEVQDTQDPIYQNCPDEIIVGNDVDLCGSYVYWSDPVAFDNCDIIGDSSVIEVARTLTTNNSFDLAYIKSSVACPTDQYQTLLAYNIGSTGVTESFTITGVRLGIYEVIGNPEVILNIYSIPALPAPGSGFLYTDLTLLWTETTMFAPGGSVIRTIPLTTLIEVYPADNIVIEFITPGSNVNGFIPGYNSFGLSTGDSYIASTACGAPDPVPVQTFGFPDVFMGGLVGLESVNAISGYIMQTEGPDPSTLFPVDTTSIEYIVFDGSGNTDTCSYPVIVNDTQNPEAICQDITVYLDAAGMVSIKADDIDGGSYDNCALDTIVASVVDFDCSIVGVNNVTLTVTDTSGNESSCVSSVTVMDTIPPTFECPGPEDVSSCLGIIPDLISGLVAEDNCDGSTVTFSQNPSVGVAFGNSPGETIVVTITATDANGNETSCEVVLTVIDEEDPYFQNCPGNLVFCNDVDQCGATVNWSQPVAFDNCDDSLEVVQTMGPAPGSFFPVGTVETIEYTATDDDDNSVTCTFTVEVEDCQNPEAECQDITIYLDAMGAASITADDIDGGSSDNCALDMIVASVLDFDCSTVGANNVTLTVTDISGNTSACISTVTVLDTIPPTFECPGAEDVSSCLGIIPDLISGLVAEDNCDGSTVTFSQNPSVGVAFGNSPGETIVVTITATDANGNETSCEVVLTVIDEEDPYFQNCPGNLLFCNDVDQCGATVNWSQPVAFDNCDDSLEVVQTMGPAPGSFFPVGTVETIEYTATDDDDNSVTCTFTIEVEDCQNPDAICQDIIVYLDAMGAVNITPFDIDGGSYDNCEIESLIAVPANFDCSMVGGNSVTLTITDTSGNADICIATVTVLDTIPPTFECPGPMNVGDCVGIIPDLISGLMGLDNCGDVAFTQNPVAGVAFGNGPGETIIVTITASDASGNETSCEVLLTIVDDESPYFQNCLDSIVVNNDVDLCGALVNWTAPVAFDNCDQIGSATIIDSARTLTTNNSLDLVDISNSLACPGGQYQSLLAYNIGSFGVTQSFSITGVRFGIFQVIGNPVVTLNIYTIPALPAPGTGFLYSDLTLIGSETAMFAPSGNAISSIILTTPIDVLPADNVVIELVTPGSNTNGFIPGYNSFGLTSGDSYIASTFCNIPEPTPVQNVLGGFTDVFMAGLMGIETVEITEGYVMQTQGPNPGTYFPVGSHDIEYVVVDGSGNSDTCSYPVIVYDSQNPDAICQDIDVYLDVMGTASIVADDIDGGSYDNCGVETVEASLLNFDCTTLGTNSVVLTVTDESNNADSCVATVTVLDTIPPSFECPGPMNVGDCVGIIPDLISDLEAVDNCGYVTFSQDPAAGVAFGNVSGDTISVTITATDGSGNATSCEVILTIVDGILPYFQNCPGDVVFCNDVDECGAILTWSQPVAFDNCDDSLEVVQTMGPAPGSFFPVGTVETIEYTATDDEGNEITCTFTLEVEDCQNPDAICQDIQVYLDENGQVSIIPADVDGGSYDNCDIESLDISMSEFSCESNTMPVPPSGELVISGVVDGPLTGGTPKAVEFYAQVDIPDLSIYGFGSANNGGGSDGEEFSFPAVSVTAGEFIYVALEATQFMNFFGFAPDYLDGAANINGDDAIELFKNAAVIDVFGDINVDGTGQPWEYLDGWAYRVSDTGPDGTTFVLGNWTFSGINALDGEISNASAVIPFPIGSYTFTPAPPPTPGTNSLVGFNAVTLVVTDLSGNMDSCVAIVTVLDTIPPTFECPGPMDVSDCAGIVPDLISELEAEDNCDGALVTFSQDPAVGLAFGNVSGDTLVVTITATDVNGNETSCEVVLTIIDEEDPYFQNCPGNVVFCNDVDECGAIITWSQPVAFDNCDDSLEVLQTMGPAPGSFFPVGTLETIEYTATDDDGNTVTCTFTVEVEDCQNPDAICQDITIYVDEMGLAMITADSINGGSYDNCAVDTTIASITEFSCLVDTNSLLPLGDLVISGIIDATLPGGIPKAIEFYAQVDIPDLSIYGFGSANNGGGSDGQEFTFPAGSVTAGTYLYLASESTAFMSFFGFAPDYTSSAALINGDDAVELFKNDEVIDVFGEINVDGTGQPWEYTNGWTYRVSETGPDGTTFNIANWTFSGVNALNGEVSNATAATPFPIGTYIFTPPVTAPVGELVISGVVDGPLSGGTPKAVEFFAQVDIPDLSIYGFGSANNGGGSDGEEFTFPAVSATAGQYIYVASESTNFMNFFGFAPDYTSSAANINGDDAIELFKNGAVIDILGEIDVDGTGQPWEHLDGWAYRVDNTGPDGTSYVLANWTFSGPNALDGETTNATAAVPFPIGTYTYTPPSGPPAPVGVLGPNQVVLTVLDAAGNADSCVAIVTVLDTIPPEFECPADLTVSGCSGTVPDLITGLEGTDNCSEVTFSQNPLPNVTFGPNANDTIGIVITAIDESGNETTCEVIVTIIDDEMPYFQNCPDTLMVCNDVDICGAKVNWIAPTAFDNCDDSLDVVQTTGPISGSIFPIGITDIEYTATDDDGNSVTCNFVVMVMDCQTPTAVCKDIFVFVDDNCEYSIGATDIDGGSSDNCAVDTMLISLDGIIWVDSLTFDIDDLEDPFVQVSLQITDSAGNVSICVATVTVIDGTDPTIICQDDITVNTEPNVCYGLIPNIIPPLDTTDNCSPIVNLDQFPEPGLLFGSLPGDSLEVFVIATDIDGNMDTCSMFVFLEDNEPPAFINCPRPNIVVKAMPGMCGAFVNFSLPVALDNCGEPIVEQTDDTGLTSGDMFPVGLTILEYIAIDSSGNTDSCSLKIIVNDEQDPTIVCPDDLTVNNDPGECGAIVNDIAPVFVEDNCMTAVTYSITNEMWPDSILVAGIDDASGNYFECGENTVTYRVADQPLLMFSEATHELATINGGTNPLPPYVVTSGDDYVEIVNLGPASMDLSCLEIHRIHAAGTDSLIVPAYTVIGVGEVLVVHFGDGTDDSGQLFFNVPTTVDLSSGDGATYVMKFGEVLDVLAVNGATSPVGGFDGAVASMLDKASTYRKWAWDSNSYQDYAIADVCMPATIGSLNPDLFALADNADTVGLQSLPVNVTECTFTVTMEDNEFPVCGEYNSYLYTGATNLGVQGSITGGTVFGSDISVTDNVIVGKVRLLNVQGTHPDMSDLMFKLTAPSGEKVLLFSELCSGTGGFNFSLDQDSLPLISAAPCGPLGQGGMFAADGDMSVFYGEPAFGTWTLEIADAVAANDGQLLNWELEVMAQEAYSQTDTTIANLPGFCLAEFTWNHPILLDNCEEGTIVLSYSTLDNIVVPNGGTVEGGAEITEYFEVGTTTITYILTDKAGNVSECGFNLTVEDTEAPVAICPADITVSLTGGECSDFIHFNIDGTDNCNVDSVVAFPPSGTEFEIGITEVVVIAYDPSGNSDTCTFLVEVIPYDPTSDVLVCNDDINVSLGPDCTAEINADMLLEGDDYFCYEDYCIEIVDINGNIVVDNIFTLDHVGMTFTATISDCLTGVNSCWTNIYVEHKIEPEIECPADTVVSCNSATDPFVLGMPVVLTCESSVDFDYVDVIEEFGMCESILMRITRSWIVTNATGNTATCDQIIEVQKFELGDIEFPGNFVLANAFECSDVAADPSLTDPSNTGNPTINGEEVFGAHFCEVNVGYWDEILQDANCSNGYEILRHWIVRDECLPLEEGVNPLRHIQAIKVNDNTAPDLVCPDDMTISTSYTDCSGALILPDPQLNDNCDVDTEYTIRVSSGALVYNGAYWVLSNLQIGTHTVTYKAVDACGNVSQCSYDITVVDDVPPIALCDHSTNISLGADGTARVYWTSLDDGSYDNCYLDRIEVKRNSACGHVSAWREYVDFCCADLGDTVMVEVGVWDIYNNFNSCWVGVFVDAKLPPTIVAPPDITVSCAYEFDLWDLSVFGTVETDASLIDDIYTDDYEYYSNCLNGQGTNPIFWGQDGFAHGTCDIEVVENYNENLECGTGVITRVFKATAGTKSKTAVQKITIIDCSPFVTNDITWPRDYTSSSCYAVGPHHGPHPDDLPTINGWPRFDNEDNCSLVAATYEDQVFQFVDSACWKVLRTWSVIDWCQYDSNDPFTDGYWQHTQVIKLKNTVKPAFDPCEDITICTDNIVDCTGWMALPSNVTDDCTPYESLDISWKIDAFADGTYDIFSSQPGMTYDDASGYYPFGTHRIFWNAEDLCGNANTCSFLFTVEDCKQPTPYCYNGLATVVMPVMPNPMVDIWANDFDAGSFDNCCATEDLQFRMIRSADNPNNVLPADDNNPATPYPTGMRLTCLDVLDVSTVVQIWVGDCGKDRNLNGVIEDNERNWDYCETYVLVQDPNNACDTTYPGAIFGDIATEEAEWIEEVTVELSSSAPGFPSLLTNTNVGHYEFPGIPLGLEYRIAPEKDGDDLNGVETYDLILIQQHILGLQQLNSYPKYIAADANDDDRISALDIIDLRKLILGIYDELPGVNSWRFADASYDFGNGIWEFPEEVDINLTGILEEGIDFTGIKIGDVDGSVQANLNNTTEDRGNGILELEIENLELEAGKEYEILVSSEDFNEIGGMQWTFKLTGIDILEISGEGLEFSSQNYAQIERMGNTYTTLSWNEKEAVSREGDLFKLRVLALTDGRLSEMLHMNSDVTKSEAYRADGERINVSMKWTGLLEDAVFALHQNEPNPWISETMISFDIPESGMTTLRVYDATGRLVYVHEEVLDAGYHEHQIKNTQLGSAGIFMYKLDHNDQQLSKRMILVE